MASDWQRRWENVTPQGPLRLVACACCGQIHSIPVSHKTFVAVCTRCHTPLTRSSSQVSAQRTAAASLAALFLYVPSITLPMVEVERLGHRHASTLLVGTWEMFTHGQWWLALVVGIFSIVLPLVKLLLLLELSLLKSLHRRHRALTYRWVQWLGKWSMLDVLLIASLVMSVKLGSLVSFHAGPAVVSFVLCVIMSMVASMSFDGHSLWSDE